MFAITTTLDLGRSMDGSDGSCASAFTMATSASSTSTNPWNTSGFVEDEEPDRSEFNWDEEDDNLLLVPKLEPLEDEAAGVTDFEPSPAMKESAVPESPSSDSVSALAKRPRGRPRKHPKPTPESLAKVAKGRSKTGCITCRKRKKKCDETKPGCEWHLYSLRAVLTRRRPELREELGQV